MAALTQHQIRCAYNLFDSDRSGCIDAEETRMAMKVLGFGDLTHEAIAKIFREIETIDDNRVEYPAFEAMCLDKMNKRDSPEELLKAFQLLDLDGKGKISFANLKEVAKRLDEKPGDDALLEMIVEADLDRDGFVNFDEYRSAIYSVMHK